MKGSSDQLVVGQVGATSSPAAGTINKHLDEVITKLSADPATQTTLAAVLAKLSADPATQTTLAALQTQLGEVQANPTANTVLARLKDILTGIVLAAGENHVGSVGGHTIDVTASLTRPNDTPGVYSAKDEINSSAPSYLTFSNVARINGGTGNLYFALKKTNNVNASSQLRLHLYNAAPTVNNDHAQFAELWADKAKYQGYIDFGTPQVEGTGSDMAKVQVSGFNLPFKCAAASKDLFGRVEVIVAGNAPTASQVYEFTLGGFAD